MKKGYLINLLFTGVLGLLFSITGQAGTAPNSAKEKVASTQQAKISLQTQNSVYPCLTGNGIHVGCIVVLTASSGVSGYITVNNNSQIIARNIKATLPADWDVIQDASQCVSLAPGTSCRLRFTPGANAHDPASIPVKGSNTTTATYTMSVVPAGSTTLQVAPAELALSMSGLSVPSGKTRYIRITNYSDIPAMNLTVSYPQFPAGTTVDTSATTCINGITLAPGYNCTIAIKPGAVSSSNCVSGSVPAPAVISVNANGAPPIQVGVVVLGFGCQYQSGFVFSIDDSIPPTGNLIGKTVSLVNQSTVPWDADPACTSACTDQTNAWDLYHGENLSGVPGSTNPGNSGTNGPGNTWLISSVLNNQNGNSNVSPATYAAGVCISYTGGNYTNWYLPAACELDSVTNPARCSAGTQNILGNLGFLIGNPMIGNTSCGPPSGTTCLVGPYWSSTEIDDTPNSVWYSYFDSNMGSFQLNSDKYTPRVVRCVRIFNAVYA